MRLVTTLVIGAIVGSAGLSAAPQTWTGAISDSMCSAKHASMGDKKMSDRECTEMCVKANAKYVFVTQGRVYAIADQKDPALASHAGHMVTLTGEMTKGTIAVARIAMPKGEQR